MTPLTTTLIQSTFLNALSNILAQAIDQHQKNKPFHLNTPALLQFLAYAIVIVPINFSWQNWLEAQYPGFPSLKGGSRGLWCWARRWKRGHRGVNSVTGLRNDLDHDVHVDGEIDRDDGVEKVKDKPVGEVKGRGDYGSSSSSGASNFWMKFMLDQTVGSVVNIVLFLALICFFKGEWGETWVVLGKDFWPIMIARLKYRPVVSTLLFTVVPVEKRVVFGSACGVIWSVYLSLYAAV